MSSDTHATRYEHTDKLKNELSSRVVSQAHLDTWAAQNTVRIVIFQLQDPTKSPTRRRVLQWALDRGYLRPVATKPKDAPRSNSVADLLSEVEARLEGSKP